MRRLDRGMRRATRSIATMLAASLLVAVAAAPASAAAPSDAARAKTRIPCYRGYDFDTLRLRTTPRRCMQFVHNEPNHANEVNLRRIAWRHWGRAKATGKGVWVYFGTGGSQTRTHVRLRAYKRVRYCARYYSRLRVAWTNDQGTRQHLTLKPPYPPGGCE